MSLSTFQYMLMRGLAPSTATTDETRQDTLTRTEASVLSFLTNTSDEELCNRATTIVSDIRLHKLLRAIVAIKASEVVKDSIKATGWRRVAYMLAESISISSETSNDCRQIKAWMGNLKMLHGGVSIDIDTFKSNLYWLLPTKIHGTIPMALLLLRTILAKYEKDWDTAGAIHNKLKFHANQEGVDISPEEQKEIDAFAGRIRTKDA